MMRHHPLSTIPAKAGIQRPLDLVPRLRGDKLRGGDEWDGCRRSALVTVS